MIQTFLMPHNSMKISFYFKQSQSETLAAQGYGIIYYYILQNSRKSKEISTKIKCHSSEWDKQRDRFVGNDDISRNRHIEAIRTIITQNKTIKEALQEPVTVNDLLSSATVAPRFRMLFSQVMNNYITEQFQKIRKPNELKHKGNIELSTWESYGKRQKNILLFIKEIKRKDLTAFEFDERMCERFDTWMVATGRGQNYSTKHVKLIRTVLDFAKRSNLIKVNFTQNYKNKHESIKTVRTLQPSDYEKVKAAEHLFTETEKKYVDVMVFMRETYLHIGDYRELNEKEHLQTDELGKLWIVKPRKKRIEEGRQIQIIPVSKIALELMNKYGGIDQMPKTSDTCVNKYIKMAFAKAGIDKNVSTKLGRSSGISYGFNKRKLRGETIAFVAGWTTTRELGSYLEICREDLSNEFLKDEF